jgi:hypothetical protein
MNDLEKNKPTQETITYITLLTALQVVQNCQLDLKGTNKSNAKQEESVRKTVALLKSTMSKDKKTIWTTDEMTSADLMITIEKIAELIAKNDGIGLHTIIYLLNNGIDLNRCAIQELSDEEIEEFKRTGEAKVA